MGAGLVHGCGGFTGDVLDVLDVPDMLDVVECARARGDGGAHAGWTGRDADLMISWVDIKSSSVPATG